MVTKKGKAKPSELDKLIKEQGIHPYDSNESMTWPPLTAEEEEKYLEALKRRSPMSDKKPREEDSSLRLFPEYYAREVRPMSNTKGKAKPRRTVLTVGGLSRVGWKQIKRMKNGGRPR